MTTSTSQRSSASIQTGRVVANRLLCSEHYRLSMRVDHFPQVAPGQFVHLSPDPSFRYGYHTHEGEDWVAREEWQSIVTAPLLRRAFSVAEVSRQQDGVTIDIIYRVVGTATRWLESLRETDSLSVLGPLGNGFPISKSKPVAWMVAGGVGLPPMLLLASALQDLGKKSVAFCGARSSDLLPLSFDESKGQVPTDGTSSMCCKEFSNRGSATVISTDDGSIGMHGHVGQAMEAYFASGEHCADDIVVYTCGPERMMQAVAELCAKWGTECYACMERAMACGTGLCQSCVVGETDENDAGQWRYRLCCTDGPVFETSRIRW